MRSRQVQNWRASTAFNGFTGSPHLVVELLFVRLRSPASLLYRVCRAGTPSTLAPSREKPVTGNAPVKRERARHPVHASIPERFRSNLRNHAERRNQTAWDDVLMRLLQHSRFAVRRTGVQRQPMKSSPTSLVQHSLGRNFDVHLLKSGNGVGILRGAGHPSTSCNA